VASIVVAASVLTLSVETAAAAATCTVAVQDRFDPGDEVTVVGYTRGCVPAAVETSMSPERPLNGFLHRDPCDLLEPPGPDEPSSMACSMIRNEPPPDPTGGIPVGRFTVGDTVHAARGRRISLTFRLPDDLAAGVYLVEICQDPCVTDGNRAWSGYGWPTPIHVGVDPAAGERPVRAWPKDDPAIDDLPDDALVYGPDGQTITAAELRATLESGKAESGGRVDTTASAETDEPEHGGRISLWLATAGLLTVLTMVAFRLGAGSKQVRPKAE
jgi:hypothetical protein